MQTARFEAFEACQCTLLEPSIRLQGIWRVSKPYRSLLKSEAMPGIGIVGTTMLDRMQKSVHFSTPVAQDSYTVAALRHLLVEHFYMHV